MLPGGSDPMYRQALATSHRPYLNVQILDGNGNLLADDIPYRYGVVTANLNSRVTRTLSLELDESFYPFDEGDLLAPYGNMIKAWRGIEFADGTRFRWVVFIGRIQYTALNETDEVSVRASDLCADVIDDRFPSPQNSTPGVSVEQQIRELISNAVPSAVFAPFDITAIPAQPLSWQLERGQALDELASSASAFWYARADGAFVARRYPWTVAAAPVAVYSDGDGGNVTMSRAERSRSDVYNSLTVTGERLNGDSAAYATAQDTATGSLTRYGGPFGRRHALMRLQTPASQSAAQAAANANLRRLISPVESWTVWMTPDASLELGDVVSLDVRGRTGIVQCVSGMTVPLDAAGPMAVFGRSLVVPTLEEVS